MRIASARNDRVMAWSRPGWAGRWRRQATLRTDVDRIGWAMLLRIAGRELVVLSRR